MPSSIIKGIAEKSGKSEEEVEKLWNKAKEVTKKEYPEVDDSSDKFFEITTGILKKMSGLKESFIDSLRTEMDKITKLSEVMHKEKSKEEDDEEDDDEEDEKTKKKMKKDDSEKEVDEEDEKE